MGIVGQIIAGLVLAVILAGSGFVAGARWQRGEFDAAALAVQAKAAADAKADADRANRETALARLQEATAEARAQAADASTKGAVAAVFETAKPSAACGATPEDITAMNDLLGRLSR
jgi:hypothetical protein